MNYIQLTNGTIFRSEKEITFNEAGNYTGDGAISLSTDVRSEHGRGYRYFNFVKDFTCNLSHVVASWKE